MDHFIERTVDEYVDNLTWRTQANANHNRSFTGLQAHISGTVLAKYTLGKLGRYGKRHLDGFYHLHNLEGGIYSRYCNGNDLLMLLMKGLHNPVGVSSKPAKHLSTALDHMINMTYMMTNEFQGAQAWRDVDILLAPFIQKDHLSYEQVKQEIQQMIWSFSYPMRHSFQTPFVNITWGLRPSKYYSDLHSIIGGEIQNDLMFSDLQDEIDMINKAFLETMIDSPDGKIPFTFPLPTYNITKDFKWNSEVADLIFELARRWGSPYFANYLYGELSEEDALSMCCRLRLNLSEVQRASGGIWNFGANTGSLAVFTLNLPRIGYLANGNETKFYGILDNLLNEGKNYLLTKKACIDQGTKLGLYPLSTYYIGEKLMRTYFLTIGINGLNECSINFSGLNILDNEKWCREVLDHISKKILFFQQETSQLFNFEATPAEGCSYSLARIDREKFPGIFTQGDDQEPYYTGSSLIPANIPMYTDRVLKHQEGLQRHYTGGSVTHIDEGDVSLSYSTTAVKNYIRRACETYTLPYLTWSPTLSICEVHGKSGGKACCDKAVTYTRVVGFYRPVSNFNVGKKREFNDKIFYKRT